MMTAQCCKATKITGSILPVAALAALPKCPLCLAAWLTLVTGVSFPAAGAAWLRTSILLVWVAFVTTLIWRGLRQRKGREAGPISGRT